MYQGKGGSAYIHCARARARGRGGAPIYNVRAQKGGSAYIFRNINSIFRNIKSELRDVRLIFRNSKM